VGYFDNFSAQLFDAEAETLIVARRLPHWSQAGTASFPDEAAMLAQCESWKHFTAMKINRRQKRRGRFWQQDGFDHLVRSEEQFEYLRKYIASNPSRAQLRPGEYIHYSRALIS